jgi:hypothetical protein
MMDKTVGKVAKLSCQNTLAFDIPYNILIMCKLSIDQMQITGRKEEL